MMHYCVKFFQYRSTRNAHVIQIMVLFCKKKIIDLVQWHFSASIVNISLAVITLESILIFISNHTGFFSTNSTLDFTQNFFAWPFQSFLLRGLCCYPEEYQKEYRLPYHQNSIMICLFMKIFLIFFRLLLSHTICHMTYVAYICVTSSICLPERDSDWVWDQE